MVEPPRVHSPPAPGSVPLLKLPLPPLPAQPTPSAEQRGSLRLLGQRPSVWSVLLLPRRGRLRVRHHESATGCRRRCLAHTKCGVHKSGALGLQQGRLCGLLLFKPDNGPTAHALPDPQSVLVLGQAPLPGCLSTKAPFDTRISISIPSTSDGLQPASPRTSPHCTSPFRPRRTRAEAGACLAVARAQSVRAATRL